MLIHDRVFMASNMSDRHLSGLTAKVARNLATMQSAKEAFIQCEADKIIAETLKSRIYIGC